MKRLVKDLNSKQIIDFEDKKNRLIDSIIYNYVKVGVKVEESSYVALSNVSMIYDVNETKLILDKIISNSELENALAQHGYRMTDHIDL